MRNIILLICSLLIILPCSTVFAAQTNTLYSNPSHQQKISLIWQPIAGAVKYEVNIVDKNKTIIAHFDSIFAAGYEFDSSNIKNIDNLFWQMRGLDINNDPVNSFSVPQLLAQEQHNNIRPITTTEFNKMNYTPIYPVYSWIPYLKAAKYNIRVYRDDNHSFIYDKLVNSYNITDNTFDFYDSAAYTIPGKYYWMIQALDKNNQPISRWSLPSYFSVTAKNIKVAALGDSRTHGGGAISTPPGYKIYDWESYSQVPVLNIGYSGDTTAAMLNRFNHDVLPFKPRILIIMGGINDIRAGIKASESIKNLTAIYNLCQKNNIIPILVSVSPINPTKMKNINLTPVSDWQEQLRILNKWIISHKNSIDIAPLLTDGNGLLPENMTTDGLHQDKAGKKIIGETISDYLQKNYIDILAK
ncbi:SGNH/GDSL hydrolase family protein [Pectinatus brassicae]|uniref:Lysophospholipase L1-like esterase n=1 Tax=Pectinatus brassicae TaxID=862415 RepID=A0A840UYC3_9FIRM|nr:GDSL-type esterase/lipase family protein [Pectinatus brassicae]MBB5337375.1 lysophospholipase L1-like esterase [Pectinatus brassicae]